MSILRTIPLLFFPMLAFYCCTITGTSGPAIGWLSIDGSIILFGTLCLLIEVAKSTLIGVRVMVDHILSLLLLIGALLAMVLLPDFKSETFLILFSFACVDVMGGFIISQRVAQRDIGISAGII